MIRIDTILQTCWNLTWIFETSDRNWCDSSNMTNMFLWYELMWFYKRVKTCIEFFKPSIRIDTIHQTCLNMFLWYKLIRFCKHVETWLEFLKPLIRIDATHQTCLNMFLWYELIRFYKCLKTCIEFLNLRYELIRFYKHVETCLEFLKPLIRIDVIHQTCLNMFWTCLDLT